LTVTDWGCGLEISTVTTAGVPAAVGAKVMVAPGDTTKAFPLESTYVTTMPDAVCGAEWAANVNSNAVVAETRRMENRE
jgi:hypothetical protein